MKRIEQDIARKLRQEGLSMNEIVSRLGVAKSSVSLWVRDIELTKEQKNRLSARCRSIESIELRRTARLANEKCRRRKYFDEGVADIEYVSKQGLFFIGCALYWGEGGKTKRGTIDFTNSDPRAIQIMMRFFREEARVREEQFRGRLALHSHLDAQMAEQFWSNVSGIPPAQFYKTSTQQSRASLGKKDSLPLGTFSVCVHDTVLYLRLMGWLEGIYLRTLEGRDYHPSRYDKFL